MPLPTVVWKPLFFPLSGRPLPPVCLQLLGPRLRVPLGFASLPSGQSQLTTCPTCRCPCCQDGGGRQGLDAVESSRLWCCPALRVNPSFPLLAEELTCWHRDASASSATAREVLTVGPCAGHAWSELFPARSLEGKTANSAKGGGPRVTTVQRPLHLPQWPPVFVPSIESLVPVDPFPSFISPY